MNSIMEQLLNRKSVRVFTKQVIDKEIKDKILQAAMQSPTAGNMMLYSIIDVTSQEIKDALSKSCDNQPFIKDAKMILIFLADYSRWYHKFKVAGCENIRPLELSDLLLASNDAIIAAQTAVVAADSYGIGSCYIGDIIEQFEFHQQLLNLPPMVAPVSMVVFGYPTKQQQERKQPSRFDRDMIVFENQYQSLTDLQLEQYYDNDRAKAFYQRKHGSDFSYEMVRSCKEIFKNWQKEIL